ncbi:hypothetical protein BgiMline_002992 [Biomphalaria glabrata]
MHSKQSTRAKVQHAKQAVNQSQGTTCKASSQPEPRYNMQRKKSTRAKVQHAKQAVNQSQGTTCKEKSQPEPRYNMQSKQSTRAKVQHAKQAVNQSQGTTCKEKSQPEPRYNMQSKQSTRAKCKKDLKKLRPYETYEECNDALISCFTFRSISVSRTQSNSLDPLFETILNTCSVTLFDCIDKYQACLQSLTLKCYVVTDLNKLGTERN